jgi:hypothetical protein
MNITLNFINRSSDTNNSSVVIFQADPRSTGEAVAAPVHAFDGFVPGSRQSVQLVQSWTLVIEIDGLPELPSAPVTPSRSYALELVGGRAVLADQAATAPGTLALHNTLAGRVIVAALYRNGTLAMPGIAVEPGRTVTVRLPLLFWVASHPLSPAGAANAQSVTALSLDGADEADVIASDACAGGLEFRIDKPA